MELTPAERQRLIDGGFTGPEIDDTIATLEFGATLTAAGDPADIGLRLDEGKTLLLLDVLRAHSTGEPKYHEARTDLLPFIPPGASRVLDIGCGGGGFGATLLRRMPDVHLTGVEPEQAGVNAAREVGYRRVEHGLYPEAAAPLPDGAFDTILFFDVLEHMPDPEPALTATHRLAAPGGRVIASIPNARHITVWWPLIRAGRFDYTDYGLLDRTHLRWFTRATMIELFERTGWQVERVTGINRARWPEADVDTWKTRLLSRVTRGRSDSFFYVQYVVEAVRAP